MNVHQTQFARLFVLLLAMAIPCAAFGDDAPAIFKSKCAPCHAADGSGNTPMGKKIGAKALGSPEVQKQSDTDLQKIITSGKGKMPSFSNKLSGEQIGGMVKFIRSFAAK